MSSNGIADKVAIVAMGCTSFGEHWDRSADDLLVDAMADCFDGNDRISLADVDAFWLGTLGSGQSGLTLSKPLALDYKPVTRVENYCASGSESFRNACYAVASGAYDKVMAVGVEKLKDSGFSGLLRGGDPPGGDGTAAELSMTAPAAFSLLDPAYCARYGVDPRANAFGNDAHSVEEPRERCAESQGAVQIRSFPRADRERPAGRGKARCFRLLRRVRRCRLRIDRPRGGRTPLHRHPPDVCEGTFARCGSRVGCDRPRLRLHDFPPRGCPQCPGRVRTGGGSSTRAHRFPWLRCTTASRPLNLS